MEDPRPRQDVDDLEGRIREALERGEDIRELVRQLTLKRMSELTQDLGSLRAIASAVIRGAKAGVRKDLERSQDQTGLAVQRLKEAVAGLDAALSQFALASRLALEEAASRARQLPKADLDRIRQDLESLDPLFFEALEEAGEPDSLGRILRDLAGHLRTQGTSVGAQAQESLTALGIQVERAGRSQAQVGAQLAQGGLGLIRQLTAGALTGLADRIQPRR
nr:DUF6781 family protein [uncultured Holophaga sp.]